MRYKWLNRMITGFTTIAVTLSSATPSLYVMAEEENDAEYIEEYVDNLSDPDIEEDMEDDFIDILEDKFEEEAEEEYIEEIDDEIFEYEEKIEDQELLGVNASYWSWPNISDFGGTSLVKDKNGNYVAVLLTGGCRGTGTVTIPGKVTYYGNLDGNTSTELKVLINGSSLKGNRYSNVTFSGTVYVANNIGPTFEEYTADDGVTYAFLDEAFRDNINLVSVSGLSNLICNNVYSFDSMFEGCSSLKNLSWGIGRVRGGFHASRMWAGCDSLETLNLTVYVNEYDRNQLSYAGVPTGCSASITVYNNEYSAIGYDAEFDLSRYGCEADALPALNAGLGFDGIGIFNADRMLDSSTLKEADLSGMLIYDFTEHCATMFGSDPSADTSSIKTLRMPQIWSVPAEAIRLPGTYKDSTGQRYTEYATSTTPDSVTLTKIIAVNDISMEQTYTTLEIGEQKTLSITILPEDALDKSVTWSSSNTDIVTVSDGRIMGVGAGYAYVYAITNDGDKSACCRVTVKNPAIPVTGISINESSLFISRGESATLLASVIPSNATNKTITWSSTDPRIVYVSSYGRITARAEGTAQIIATSGDGEKTAICTVTVTEPPVSVSRITMSAGYLNLTVGEVGILTAAVYPANASNKTISWKTDKSSVATVNASGVVTAIAPGTAVITATSEDGNRTATCLVTVKQPAYPVAGITLNSADVVVTEGDAFQLSYTIEPSYATNQNVSWRSSAPAVANVSSKGKVTAVSAGEAYIYVTTEDGGYSAVCTVTVKQKEVPVSSVSLEEAVIELVVGEKYTILPQIAPADATNQSLLYESANKEIVTVTDTGMITAKSAGTTQVSVTTVDGFKTASCIVRVTNPYVSVSGVSLSQPEATMKVGGTLALTPNVEPAYATDKSVLWDSSNPDVAKIDEKGTVTGIKEGVSIITVTTKDGNYTTICTVRVSPDAVAVSGVSVDPVLATLKTGETLSLTSHITPENATNKSVRYESSNEEVVTVDRNGEVMAVSAGIATVTVITFDGNKTAECEFEVLPNVVSVSEIALDKTALTLAVGNTAAIQATVKPENATNKKIEFASDHPGIATVDQNGNIIAVAAGTAVISVKSLDCDKSATCIVTITDTEIKVEDAEFDLPGQKFQKELSIYEGDIFSIGAVYRPENATDAYSYLDQLRMDPKGTGFMESYGNHIITSKGSGLYYQQSFSAKKYGSGTIDLCHEDNSGTINVYDTVAIRIQEVTTTLSSSKISLNQGEIQQLSAQVIPEYRANDMEWFSDNESVATVDPMTGKVTAIGEGTATIGVRWNISYWNKTADCQCVIEVTASQKRERVEEVERLISNIPSVYRMTLNDRDAINKAKEAYDALSEEEKAMVNKTSYTTLEKAVQAIEALETQQEKIDRTAADSVIKQIQDLPDTISLQDKDDVLEARSAYNALTADQKNLIEDDVVQKLIVSEKQLQDAQAEKEAADQKAAQNVTDMINALPYFVSVQDKDDVENAKSAYNALTADQKAFISSGTEKRLADAVHSLAKAQQSDNTKAVILVENQIQALPAAEKITTDDKDVIEKTEKAYSELTEEQKSMVDRKLVARLEECRNALNTAERKANAGSTLKYNEETGVWNYFVDGKIDYQTYAFIDYEGYKFIVANGCVAKVSGLVMDPNSDKWYFCAEGQVCQHTGLVMYEDEWFYVKDGVLDTSLNALVEYNGGLFYVAAGRILREVNGLVLDPNSPKWYFVANGEVQNQYTGLASYDGRWFYVKKGRLAVEYTGTTEYDGQIFDVESGMVV